jgi:hypothetical protein
MVGCRRDRIGSHIVAFYNVRDGGGVSTAVLFRWETGDAPMGSIG